MLFSLAYQSEYRSEHNTHSQACYMLVEHWITTALYMIACPPPLILNVNYWKYLNMFLHVGTEIIRQTVFRLAWRTRSSLRGGVEWTPLNHVMISELPLVTNNFLLNVSGLISDCTKRIRLLTLDFYKMKVDLGFAVVSWHLIKICSS